MFDANAAVPTIPLNSSEHVRCRAQPRCRGAAPGPARISGLDRTWRLAWVYDLSRAGVGLLLGQPVEPGTELDIELLTQQAIVHVAVRARVAHTTRREDGRWLVGCEFLTRLTGEELAALL